MTLIHVVIGIIILSFIKDCIDISNHLPANSCFVIQTLLTILVLIFVYIYTCIIKYIIDYFAISIKESVLRFIIK